MTQGNYSETKEMRRATGQSVQGAMGAGAAADQVPVASLLPRVDIFERDESLMLVLDVPGVAERGLDIHFEKSTLTITGDVEFERGSSDRNGMLQQIVAEGAVRPNTRTRYRRSFTLSDMFDSQRIEATLRDGVLTLEIPKAEKQKARKIPIKVGT